MRWIAILLFCLVESALRVSARYALSVRVHKFINPGNQDFNGGCCDTSCGNDCDIYFIFCLRPKDYPTASNFCPSGQFSTAGHHVSDDDIDFTIGTNLAPGVPNPLVYTGNTWSGGFQLLVRVFDNDADADDLIDEIFVNRDLAANGVYVGRQTYSDGVGSASIDLDFQASCTNNYYGPQCNVFCATVDDATGHYTCNTAGERICIEGWQDLPNCLTPECADGCHPDGGFCETAGGCMCNTGWSGDLCDQCTPATGCVHGYCNIPEDCICEVDYSGTLCNQDDDVCGHQAPCQNGATCSNLGPDDYECQCAAGYTDSDCQTEIDECQPTNPCQNGGVCMDLVAGFECQCATGWDGPTCEVNINECVPISPCQNGATCQDCEPTGPSIGGVSDPIVDECPIGYICDCPDGYYGDDCEVDIDYCESDPCMNGARCVDMLTEFVCECLAGYTGEDCGAEINECDSNPCLFGGSCMDQLANYTCSCVPGYTGDNCGTNIDDCAGNNCTENSHTCVDGIDSYECQCHPGYTGEFCETNINDCDPSPCLEGSTCTDLVNDFMCECLPGYTGPLCSENIDDCEPNPCLNDGQCDDGIQSYTCTCQPGWTGTQCETQLPFPCESDPCGPNMVCFDEGPTSYYCEPCTPGGEGCSEVSVNNTDTQEGGGGGLDGAGIGAIIGGVIGALLLFLLLLLLCCCCMRWFACCCFAPATKEDEVEVRYDAWKDGAVNVNPTYFGPNTLLRDGTMGSHAGDSLTRRSGPVNVQNPMYATPTLQRPQEGGINHQNPMYAFSANGTRSPPPLPPPRTGSKDPLLKNSPPLYDDLHPYEPIPGQRKGTTSPLVVSTGNHYQHLSDSTEGTPMVLASGKYDQLKVSAETPPVLASGKYNHLGEDSTARPQSKSMENVYIANPTQPNIVLPGAIPDPEEEKNPGKDDITNAEIPSSTENPYDTC